MQNEDMTEKEQNSVSSSNNTDTKVEHSDNKCYVLDVVRHMVVSDATFPWR